MHLKRLVLRGIRSNISRSNQRRLSAFPSSCRHVSSIQTLDSSAISLLRGIFSIPLQNPRNPRLSPSFSSRQIHSAQAIEKEFDDVESEEDGIMNEFLSRFVWIMRGKLSEVYTECDKQTIDGMLLIIVNKVVSEMEKGNLEQMIGITGSVASHDLSDDLWKTVWEVSNMVLEDMKKAEKKEKMKGFLQCAEVNEMCRFAGEVGIRGDMLRELRFKWAREKMEESDFYQSLERMRAEDKAYEQQSGTEAGNEDTGDVNESAVSEEKPRITSLPQRHGKIKYKIYGLDLSGSKWAELADKIHDMEELTWPQEPKPVSGKCKLVMEKIMSLKEEDDPSPLVAEWVELLQPSRIDWMALLDKLKEQNLAMYYKVAELVLSEQSFQSNVRDFSKLIDAHAKNNRIEDAERILKKMTENEIMPDILTSTVLVHMYGKAGNLELAKQSFESLRGQGFQPDIKLYHSMIMAYVNGGYPKMAESLMREMEIRDIKPTKEIYMALLRSFAEQGIIDGADRIATTMEFAGFQPSLESCMLILDAYGRAGEPDKARTNFDNIMNVGLKPDDRCIASMIAAYEKKNMLDKALDLLLQLEKDGIEPGVATYAVLVDWFSKMQLVDEVEQMMARIAQLGETPPFKIHVSLCDMYSRAGMEKKVLQTLGVFGAKWELLGLKDFERIINGLIAGGFQEDAQRVYQLMEQRGFAASEALKVSLEALKAFGRNRPTIKAQKLHDYLAPGETHGNKPFQQAHYFHECYTPQAETTKQRQKTHFPNSKSNFLAQADITATIVTFVGFNPFISI
ncbi:Pentatricopeptide repeat [Dillenia turbinata]|uniref:Pentatricopeptide repeat n=1 Tax=Dillenia turbinata TaxID=194707 RepID=A0AAN8Z6U9_9MAGN